MLTVCLITKNEERFLADCLASVKGIADEIIVVDTGSTDRTVEIAREFSTRVINHQWQDDFALARNVAIEAATGDWLLWIDADERLNHAENIMSLIAHPHSNLGGYILERHDISREKVSGKTIVNPIGIVRLFRRHPCIRYEGAIHERPGESILSAGFYLEKTSKISLTHLVSSLSDEVLIKKQERYLLLLNRELSKTPDDPWFLYYRGKTRWFLLDFIGALEDFSKIGKTNKAYDFLLASSYSMSAMLLAEMERFDLALESIQKSFQIVPKQSLAHYVQAEIFYRMQEYEKALSEYSLVSSSMMNEDSSDPLHGDMYITAERKTYKIGCCYLALGDLKEAYEYFRSSTEINMSDASGYFGMAVIFQHKGQIELALNYAKMANRLDPLWKDALAITSQLETVPNL